MINIGSSTLLRDVIKENAAYITICLVENIPVTCISRDNRKKILSFKVMYDNNNQFWFQNESWEYFIANDDIQKIKEISEIKWEPVIMDNGSNIPEKQSSEGESIEDEQGYGSDYEIIFAMPDDERVNQITSGIKRLDALYIQKPRQEELITEALVDTAKDAMLHNHAALMHVMSLSSEEAKKKTQNLVNSTQELVKSASRLISPDIFNDELMNTLASKSNGATIQHMTRVYLNGLAFLTYYNKTVKNSGIITKLRVSFDDRHRQFYHSLLPHIYPDYFTLEKVFQGGMRVIDEKHFYNWAAGFLIHDIGKAASVEYHEGDAAYNREIIVEHVKLGYDSVMNKTNYPREAGLITGYHHEYYGDPAGYGYFRSYLDQYRRANPHAKHGFCITFDINPMMNFEALGYFPAKVLEIIDVYDSLTDPNRKYRKPMPPREALSLMEEEFINKHQKLDLILFNIFVKFVQETKI